jgi:hypothetical protein
MGDERCVTTDCRNRRRAVAQSGQKRKRAGYGSGVASRAHTRPERRLLDFLLERDFSGRDALLRQAVTVLTAGSSCDCGCPSFSLVPDRSLPPANDVATPASEAHGRDPGGNLVGVLLFVRDGYLDDLEVFGYEGSEFGGLPDPEAMRHASGASRTGVERGTS